LTCRTLVIYPLFSSHCDLFLPPVPLCRREAPLCPSLWRQISSFDDGIPEGMPFSFPSFLFSLKNPLLPFYFSLFEPSFRLPFCPTPLSCPGPFFGLSRTWACAEYCPLFEFQSLFPLMLSFSEKARVFLIPRSLRFFFPKRHGSDLSFGRRGIIRRGFWYSLLGFRQSLLLFAITVSGDLSFFLFWSVLRWRTRDVVFFLSPDPGKTTALAPGLFSQRWHQCDLLNLWLSCVHRCRQPGFPPWKTTFLPFLARRAFLNHQTQP